MEIPRASWKEVVDAIKAQCVECFGGVQREVKGCTSPKCSLYPYRLGVKMKGRKGREGAFRSEENTRLTNGV